jgi:hypothetical protein
MTARARRNGGVLVPCRPVRRKGWSVDSLKRGTKIVGGRPDGVPPLGRPVEQPFPVCYPPGTTSWPDAAGRHQPLHQREAVSCSSRAEKGKRRTRSPSLEERKARLGPVAWRPAVSVEETRLGLASRGRVALSGRRRLASSFLMLEKWSARLVLCCLETSKVTGVGNVTARLRCRR